MPKDLKGASGHSGHMREPPDKENQMPATCLAPEARSETGGAAVSEALQPGAPFDVELAQAVLDHLSVGVALFGRGMRLVFINRAAL